MTKRKPSALDAGICQPDAVRENMTCSSAKTSQPITQLWDTTSKGKVTSYRRPPEALTHCDRPLYAWPCMGAKPDRLDVGFFHVNCAPSRAIGGI